jgi:hypothetical protein
VDSAFEKLDALPRQFLVVAKRFGSNDSRILLEFTEEPIYFSEVLTLTFGKPNIRLYHGKDRTGSVIAAARFSLSSKGNLSPGINIVLGEGHKDSPGWQNMKYDEVLSWEYLQYWNHNDKVYVWKRAHKDDGARTILGHMKMENDAGQVVALFVRKVWSTTVRGTLRMCDNLGADWEAMTVLTAMTLIEHQNRQEVASM